LPVYHANTAIAQNDDWDADANAASDIESAAQRAGVFGLILPPHLRGSPASAQFDGARVSRKATLGGGVPNRATFKRVWC